MKGSSSGNEVIDERYRQIHQENWQTGTTFGRTLSKSFVSWKPFVWNTVCVVINNTTTHITTFINSVAVYESNEFKIDMKREEHSLSIMGWLGDGVYYWPMFGALTDLHIWGSTNTDSF